MNDKVARLCVRGKAVEGEVVLTVPDYVAIGALIVLCVGSCGLDSSTQVIAAVLIVALAALALQS